jgi:hypothetical protein
MAKQPNKNTKDDESKESKDFSSDQSKPMEKVKDMGSKSQEKDISDQSEPRNMEVINADTEERGSITETAPSPEFLSSLTLGEYSDEMADMAGVWHNGLKVAGLWSINQTKNAYANISTLGWKKIANKHDSAIVSLNILLSHAKEFDRNVNIKMDNNMIVEVYVF